MKPQLLIIQHPNSLAKMCRGKEELELHHRKVNKQKKASCRRAQDGKLKSICHKSQPGLCLLLVPEQRDHCSEPGPFQQIQSYCNTRDRMGEAEQFCEVQQEEEDALPMHVGHNYFSGLSGSQVLLTCYYFHFWHRRKYTTFTTGSLVPLRKVY